MRRSSGRSDVKEEWMIYLTSAVLVAFMAVFFVMIFGMLFYNDDDVITGWDFVMPIVGAAAVLFMSVHLYVTRRAQAQREQRFGESLRDQLGRRIAQLDDQATRAVRVPCVQLIAILVAGMALFLAGIRVNLEPNEPFDRWGSIIRMILVFAIFFVAAVWVGRRSVQRDLLPRKRRLEALLKELDGQ